MKARKVKGLDPGGPFKANVERIVATRVKELYSFDPHGDAQTLHDMRIAAKRLRYVLELSTPALGEVADKGAREAKALQTLLGEVHDCDQMLALIAEHEAGLRTADAEAALKLAPRAALDLPATTVKSLPNRLHYRGLAALTAYFTARRELLHARFIRKWERLERAGFRELLLDTV
ncbi:MAG TPA: CHAD domain-containing protein [Thermoleophilaceae bacterium]